MTDKPHKYRCKECEGLAGTCELSFTGIHTMPLLCPFTMPHVHWQPVPRRNRKKNMGYFEHLHANFAVSRRALREATRQVLLAILHALHGLVPCKYTDHHWYDI